VAPTSAVAADSTSSNSMKSLAVMTVAVRAPRVTGHLMTQATATQRRLDRETRLSRWLRCAFISTFRADARLHSLARGVMLAGTRHRGESSEIARPSGASLGLGVAVDSQPLGLVLEQANGANAAAVVEREPMEDACGLRTHAHTRPRQIVRECHNEGARTRMMRSSFTTWMRIQASAVSLTSKKPPPSSTKRISSSSCRCLWPSAHTVGRRTGRDWSLRDRRTR